MAVTYDDLHRALDEALHESAPLAWDQAPQLCRSTDGGMPCQAYHRVWQYLLLLKVVSSLRTDSAFLIGQLRTRLTENPAARILVSGAADYGMLAHVMWAAGLVNAAPRIVVLDRCATPLMLNRWYADRCGAKIVTVQADVLTFKHDEFFDIICTHSFLGWFAPPDRTRLVARWRALLAPGGVLITTKRLWPEISPDEPQQFDEEEKVRFRKEVRAAALRQGLDHMADALGETILAHADTFIRYRMATRAALEALFADNGLPIVWIDDGKGNEPGSNRPSATTKGAGLRLRFVAQRPVEA